MRAREVHGPGAIHLLNGLYDAKLDHQPVLAVVGQQARTSLGSEYQQELDVEMLFGDCCSFVETVVDAAQVRHVVDRAVRIALARRAPTAVVLPTTFRPPTPRRSRARARHRALRGFAEWWKVVEARAFEDADPINPQRVFWDRARSARRRRRGGDPRRRIESPEEVGDAWDEALAADRPS